MLQVIRENIENRGHHIYVVAGQTPTPRFAYTIGLKDFLGCELILAGASIFTATEVTQIINGIVDHLKKPNPINDEGVALGDFG